jgi:hypothetical protein
VKKKHKAHPSINLSMARTTSQLDDEAMASPKALGKRLQTPISRPSNQIFEGVVILMQQQ